jgi:hypothetical protein
MSKLGTSKLKMFANLGTEKTNLQSVVNAVPEFGYPSMINPNLPGSIGILFFGLFFTPFGRPLPLLIVFGFDASSYSCIEGISEGAISYSTFSSSSSTLISSYLISSASTAFGIILSSIC